MKFGRTALARLSGAPAKARALAACVAAVALCFALATSSSERAHAATRSAPLQVGASVGDRCTVLTQAIAFGYYRQSDLLPNDAQGTISLNCNAGRQIFVRMQAGLNPGPGSSNPNPLRRMTDGAGNYLNYNIYRNAARTQIWGNTGATDITVNGPYPMLIPAYGRIPALQSPQPGDYADTVVVSINF